MSYSPSTLIAFEKAADALESFFREVAQEQPGTARDMRRSWESIASEVYHIEQCKTCEHWLDAMDINVEHDCYRCAERTYDQWEHDHDAYDNYRRN